LQRKPVAGPAAPGITVANGVVESVLRVSGMTAAPNAAVLLAPRLPGNRRAGAGHFSLVLQEVTTAGSRVRKGDVVASFDRLLMLNRLDDYRAQVAQHEGMIRKLKADLDVKRAQHNQRIRVAKARVEKAVLDLKTAPVRSAIQIERFQLDRQEARADYEELLKQAKLMEISEGAAIRKYELDLQDARLEMKRAQANADRMVLHAPMDGLVVLTPIRRGAEMGQVQAGDQIGSGHAIMQIVDTRSVLVNATLNQLDIERVQMGMRARVHLDAYPGMELPGRVVGIGYYATPNGYRADHVRSIPIRVAVEGGDANILPDLSASADLLLDRSVVGPVVPLEYLSSEHGKQIVYVRAKDGWEKRPVELGAHNYTHAAVLAGIRAGERIGRPADVARVLP
jgi:multidrug efflux pump subunit AcrA (membrane-fusion protein)